MMEFINAIKAYSNISFVITKSNADKGGDVINSILDREEKKVSNLYVFASLGAKRYLSLMKYAEFVIGNSSSGIVETPAMHIPTVNIGDRQKGRLQSESTINCGTSCKEIIDAIEKALSLEMKSIAVKVESPYGDGNAAEKMTEIILETIKHPIDLKKKFYNLKVD
jgi:GDP/UDP-N,N'-diacetylbacillosamine 2-epimerase (hydrolysing)